MPCGPSIIGGTIGGAQNGPHPSGSVEGPGGSAHNVGSPNTISTISTDHIPIQGPTPFSSRPPLPPPPRSSHCVHGRPLSTSGNESATPVEEHGTNDDPIGDRSRPWWKSWNRKYVLLCGMCGLSSLLLGSFYLVIYFVLRSYTSSLQFFQTMPTYIPACVLMVTGLLVLCFMRRKNRVSILIKVVGILCLVCAVVCVVVTVTTTVLHMNRLQTLRECTFYTQLHSCSCLPFTDEEPFELKLDIRITTCDVIHGPLYSCLRAMFGVSVIGILVSIFSCMLVYQLLSHEKKKMYWEQLENRRRFLYRRTPLPSNNNCNCCDEYGFVSPSELYPWRMWDSLDERYWPGGAQLYSPAGEDSSNASRSVLLGSTNPNGAPSLWLPWGGAWGAPTSHSQGQQRDASTPAGSAGTPADPDNGQNEDNRPQTTGVLLRPFLPRGLEARFGLRRQPPPPPGHSRRPLSDPGVALQLPRYPPPFSEAFLPPLPYEGLEAFSRLMWDPPPPYSQPASQENLAALHSPHSPTSPQDTHHAIQVLTSPSRRPHTLADLIRGAPPACNTGISSPSDVTDPSGSPAHFAHLKDIPCVLGSTGSLPLNHRMRRLPLGHVKSLGDVTETARESLEAIFCDGKELSSLEKLSTHGDVAQRLLALKARHMKGGSDPRGVYAKGEQESELYFADVSSCVSLRQDDKDDTLYYSEPQKDDKGNETDEGHVYERVRCQDEHDEDEDEEEEVGSHHTSDDTMIVHTSSSENTYSVTSPLTDHSSTSPMATDTDAYSSYQAPSPKSPPQGEEANLNLHPQRRRHRHPSHGGRYPSSQVQGRPSQRYNDNDQSEDSKEEPRYEAIPGDQTVPVTSHSGFVAPSDLNGNVALSTGQHEGPVVRQAQRTNLSLPLRRVLPASNVESGGSPPVRSPEGEAFPASQGRRHRGSQDRSSSNTSSEPNTPADRRLQSVQDHLFTLKSVNV